MKLLTEALGFRISDYIGTMTFLHCNPRHHSIAIQPSNPDLPRSRDKKMWHFMLETADASTTSARRWISRARPARRWPPRSAVTPTTRWCRSTS